MDKLTINDRQLPRNLFEMAKNAQKGKEAKINELLTKVNRAFLFATCD